MSTITIKIDYWLERMCRKQGPGWRTSPALLCRRAAAADVAAAVRMMSPLLPSAGQDMRW